jgi:hypothetical protein
MLPPAHLVRTPLHSPSHLFSSPMEIATRSLLSPAITYFLRFPGALFSSFSTPPNPPPLPASLLFCSGQRFSPSHTHPQSSLMRTGRASKCRWTACLLPAGLTFNLLRNTQPLQVVCSVGATSLAQMLGCTGNATQRAPCYSSPSNLRPCR